MSVGFTGTQRGMSDAQKRSLHSLLVGHVGEEFHHGDCIGADAEAHVIAGQAGLLQVIHPPKINSKRAWMRSLRILTPQDYMVRNEAIVRFTDFLIATPGEDIEQVRSGTWTTVRMARKHRKKVIVLLPSGDIL